MQVVEVVPVDQPVALGEVWMVSAPSALRSRTMQPWTTLVQELGGSSPHTASARVSALTGMPWRTASVCSTTRSRRPRVQSAPSSSNGPRMPIPMRLTVDPCWVAVNRPRYRRDTGASRPLKPADRAQGSGRLWRIARGASSSRLVSRPASACGRGGSVRHSASVRSRPAMRQAALTAVVGPRVPRETAPCGEATRIVGIVRVESRGVRLGTDRVRGSLDRVRPRADPSATRP